MHFLCPMGTHEKPLGLLALHGGFAATAFGALDQSIGHLRTKNHRIGFVVRRRIANTLQPKSMVVPKWTWS